MTQEIKLGLLLGLGFVIMVGILLSEYFRSTLDTPSSMMVDAGGSVRGGLTSPGTANPPIHVVAPQDSPPKQRVPTNEDMNPPMQPVIPSNPAHPAPQRNPGAPQLPPVNPDLQKIAQQYGQEFISANPDHSAQAQGQSQNQYPLNTQTIQPVPPPAAPKPREYEAQPGDSLSRMAKTLLGANTATNRLAIINANPSLKDDPDHVVAGKTYVIPAKADAAAPAAPTAQTPPPPEPDQSNSKPAPTKEVIYTVQANDSLWKIANNVVGDPSTVDAIKELNADVLNGNDVIKVGMKLRLPKNTAN